jgi:xanthine/CO dehydrogenase XdhC/CoxF family maturation factor
MLHELKNIVEAALEAETLDLSTVFVSVVALEGSSYRRPGVRMLMRSDGAMAGAVSGGCVEKEIWVQAQSVFIEGKPKLITYDGRFRLGCEGLLYIMIEPLKLQTDFVTFFRKGMSKREPLEILSVFSREDSHRYLGGTFFKSPEGWLGISAQLDTGLLQAEGMETYHQQLAPRFKLVIVGAEHDAVELCKYAALTGWEVAIIAAPDEAKTQSDFPGSDSFLYFDETGLADYQLDSQTAVILMTHSFTKDLKYLMAISHKDMAYLGVLGPAKRREKLLNQLLEFQEDVPDTFFDTIYGPSGLNIGAETPQEIAISVMAEILAVIRHQQPQSLREKKEGIHD